MKFISWTDYLVLPFMIAAILSICFMICNRFYPKGHPWRKYFFYGISLKMAGAVVIGLIYQYYYGGGDTSFYFYHAKVINSAFGESAAKWLGLLFHIPNDYDGPYFDYISRMEWYNDRSSYMVCCITAFFNVFSLNTYLGTSLIFSAFAFSGSWAMFRTFAKQYPHLTKYIAMATLFIPSCLLWGSGIFKDTVCMCALGWMLYACFQILIERNMSLLNFAFLALSFFVLLIVKVYILISFLPALSLWILFFYSHRIKPPALRVAAKYFVVVASAGLFSFVYVKYSDSLGKYSLDNIAKTSLVTREWIAYSSGDQGSAYDLGDFSPDIPGLLSKMPQAINVTLFRPYLWEANKSIVFLNALEAFLFLLLTLKILITVGPKKIYRAINSDPNIQFFLLFSLIFAFSVGISTYNFGSLSRYKIPCLPPYLMALVLIYYKNNPLSKRLFF